MTAWIPMPLRYSGAHTHRLSGDWKINMQNLPSGRGNQSNALRRALIAPPGHLVVVADKSQIECRTNAFICGQTHLVDMFREGKDVYSVLAAWIFNRPVDKTTEGGILRFIGKTGELGLGFGCGSDKFYNMVVRQARQLGMDMAALARFWTPKLAKTAVKTYRETHGNIKNAWTLLDTVLDTTWQGVGRPLRFGPVVIGYDSKTAYVEAPGGLRMNYYKPRRELTELVYNYGGRIHHIYGSKFLENIVQFLARMNLMHDALRIRERTGYSMALQSHDELIWVVPEKYAEGHLAAALEEMRTPPSWLPDIPLDAEGAIGRSYGECK